MEPGIQFYLVHVAIIIFLFYTFFECLIFRAAKYNQADIIALLLNQVSHM
jgi:hypothetical protein